MGLTVRYYAMFDAEISAINEGQSNLIELLNLPYESLDFELTYKPTPKLKAVKEQALSLENKVPDNVTITGNRITIDKGLYLAANPRSVNGDLILTDEKGVEAVEILVDKYLKKLTGLSRVRVKYYSGIINNLFANLNAAINSKSELLYSRNTALTGTKQLISVVNCFEAEDLIKNIIGKDNEFDNNQSWMIPTQKLISELEVINARVELRRGATVLKLRGPDIVKKKKIPEWVKVSRREIEASGSEAEANGKYWNDGVFNPVKVEHENKLVRGSKNKKQFKIVSELKNKKGKPVEIITKYQLKKVTKMVTERGPLISIKTGNKAKRLLVKRLEEPVHAYNKMWDRHDLTYKGLSQVPYITRSFKISLELGGRFFTIGTVQTRPKLERRELLIDGERALEPDFKAIHWAILYAKEKKPLIGDPYTLPSFDRDVAKICMLTFVNSENIPAFRANISKSSNPRNKKIMEEYRKAMATFRNNARAGIAVKEPNKPLIAKGWIEGLPNNVDAEKLVDEILVKHKKIAHLMNKPNIGLELQYEDSKIMGLILSKLSKEDIPVVPVHDSLICKESQIDRVVEVMKESFFEITGFNGVVEKGEKKEPLGPVYMRDTAL